MQRLRRDVKRGRIYPHKGANLGTPSICHISGRNEEYSCDDKATWRSELAGHFVGCESEVINHVYSPEKHKVYRIGVARVEDGEGLEDPHGTTCFEDRTPTTDLEIPSHIARGTRMKPQTRKIVAKLMKPIIRLSFATSIPMTSADPNLTRTQLSIGPGAPTGGINSANALRPVTS
jgi:hypothetical protein